MTGNNNTYYKSSMYEDRGENTAQEIIIALAIFQVAAIMVQEIAQEMVDTVIMMAVAAVDM